MSTYVYIVISLLGLLGGWLGYIEKRLGDLQMNIEAKVKADNRVNEIIQASLKEDIQRLESKIDMLLIKSGQLPYGEDTERK